MVLVTMMGGPSALQTEAQRGAIEMGFHVVSRERVPAEQNPNKAGFNQPRQRVATPAMNDGWTTREEHLSRCASKRIHPPGDVGNGVPVRTLRGNR